MLMLRMILAGSYEFTSPEWDDRSDTVKDLVRLGIIEIVEQSRLADQPTNTSQQQTY